MFDPFKKKDKGFEQVLETEKQVRNDLLELSRLAREILLDQRYVKFCKILEQAEENTISLLLDLHKSAIVDRYKKYDELLTELAVYRNILRSVSDLSNPEKTKREKVSFVQNFKNEMKNLINGINT
jgi:ferritin